VSTARRANPRLWERVRREVTRGSKGGKPGQWSARKAQLAVALYKKRGGRYVGRKRKDNSLAKWTREKWRTRSGKPSLKTGERYLPTKAIRALSPAEYGATTRAKRRGMRRGRQFVRQPKRIARKVRRYRRNSMGRLREVFLAVLAASALYYLVTVLPSDIMSVPLTARLSRTVAFTPPVALARVMGVVGESDPMSALQVKLNSVLLMRSDVETRLKKYVPKLYMDDAQASKAMREMAAWNNDFGAQVSAMNPNAEIPEGMRPALPQGQAMNFVSAVFASATFGLHFYENGQIGKEIAEGRMTFAQADRDLDERIGAFRLLTAMDEEGSLARIYAQQSVGALQLPVALVIIAVIAVVGAIASQYFTNSANREAKMDEFKSLCERAEKEKEKSDTARKAYENCLDALKPPPAAEDPMVTAVKVIGGVLALFVVGVYVIPKNLAPKMAANLDRS